MVKGKINKRTNKWVGRKSNWGKPVMNWKNGLREMNKEEGI